MSIDTSKMSKEKAAALEIAEAGRDTLTKSFAGDIFIGNVNFENVCPFPIQPASDKKAGNKFLLRLKSVFDKHVADNLDMYYEELNKYINNSEADGDSASGVVLLQNGKVVAGEAIDIRTRFD